MLCPLWFSFVLVKIRALGPTRYLESFYAVVLLFGLTQGPVLSVFWRSEQANAGLSPDVSVYVLFMFLQIPAVAILVSQRQQLTKRLFPLIALMSYLMWMFASTFWSTLRSQTFVASSSLIMTAFTGLYFASRFTIREQVLRIAIAMQIGLLASWWAVQRNWPGVQTYREQFKQDCTPRTGETIDMCKIRFVGNWIGIYFNKNSLAPVATVGVLSLLALIWWEARDRSKPWWKARVAILADVVLLNFLVLKKTGSATTLVAALVAVGVWIVWSLLRRIVRSRQEISETVRQAIFSVFAATLTLGVWLFAKYESSFASLLGKSSGFDGRTNYWSVSWDAFIERPIIGWGWLAAWFSPEFRSTLPESLANDFFSHSAYLEVLMGGGVIAGLMFLGFLLWAGKLSTQAFLEREGGQWLVCISVFVLVSATQESFLSGNHFFFALLIAGLTSGLIDKETVTPTSS